jgi:neurotransmitter:Na+ symporter, NSS family
MSQADRRVTKSNAARASFVPAKAMRSKRWSGMLGFVLALSGAAIGFNTVWQFPYMASQSGGGAFILIYLLFAFIVAAPLLIAEVMLGRRMHASPITAVTTASGDARARRLWMSAGWFAVIGGFLVFSYLCVIAGWALAYFVRSISGVFVGLTADGVASVFTTFVKDPEKQVFWHSAFLALALAAVARGVHRIENLARALVPTLLAILLGLVIYAAMTGNMRDAATFLFEPDFTRLSLPALMIALSQVFFSFGLGAGIAIMYGAYLPPQSSLVRASLTVIGLNSLITVAVAVAVLAIVLGGGVAPTQGPGFVFQSLPLAFDHLPFGRWFATLFFAFLVIVALLTAIALVEPVVVWLIERFNATRKQAALMAGLAAWVLGLVSIFSFNIWAFSFYFFGEKRLGGFDMLQIASAQILLPLAGVLLALFIGWGLSADKAREELQFRSPCAFDAWLWCLRVVVPLAVIALCVMLYSV